MSANSPLKHLVLIVEDEANQAEMLAYNLAAGGYQTLLADNGEDAIRLARDHQPDIILLDWMLPGISGVKVCRALRENRKTAAIPLMLITARGEEQDQVLGLDSGADDYIVKPYKPSELMARIRALLRRVRPTAGDVMQCGGLTMDLSTRTVQYCGKTVDLSNTEFRILAAMAEKPGQVFSRERLLDLAWNRDVYVEIRTVDAHIKRLRKTLISNGDDDPIRTVRGVGYAIECGMPEN